MTHPILANAIRRFLTLKGELIPRLHKTTRCHTSGKTPDHSAQRRQAARGHRGRNVHCGQPPEVRQLGLGGK